jgi:hypothetical protein
VRHFKRTLHRFPISHRNITIPHRSNDTSVVYAAAITPFLGVIPVTPGPLRKMELRQSSAALDFGPASRAVRSDFFHRSPVWISSDVFHRFKLHPASA